MGHLASIDCGGVVVACTSPSSAAVEVDDAANSAQSVADCNDVFGASAAGAAIDVVAVAVVG